MLKDLFVFETYVTLAVTPVLQLIQLLHNCLGHLNLEDIYKLIYVAIDIKIWNHHSPVVWDSCAQRKHKININYDMTSQADFAYNLTHLDPLRLITLVSYDSAKYAAFYTNNLSRY